MNKQIIITEGDYGIELQVQFLDSSKNPVPLTDYSVEIDFVNPDGELITPPKIVQITDAVNGICSYILQATETNITGLWKTYWKVYDEDNYVTAQEDIFYYIKEKDGGVS